MHIREEFPIKTSLLLIIVLQITACSADSPLSKHLGGWSGTLKNCQQFVFQVDLEQYKNSSIQLVLTGPTSRTVIPLREDGNQGLIGQFADQMTARVDRSIDEPVLFLQTGHHLSQVPLARTDFTTWSGQWSLLLTGQPQATLYLSLDEDGAGQVSASTYFREPTFHYQMGQNFELVDDTFRFRDIRSNIHYVGKLSDQRIDLTLRFLDETASLVLEPLAHDQWQIGDVPPHASITSAALINPMFSRLGSDIENDTLERTHAVVIAQRGTIIHEQYFDGFTDSIPHDTRSMSKSMASALIGAAIGEKLIANEQQTLASFLKADYPGIDWKNGKQDITLAHLLTMSSGLDAIDFGINRTSFAHEGAYQNSSDWTRHVLSAPMINVPGKQANYGSGNPHLLAPILQSRLKQPLAVFIHHHLFGPLGMSAYRLQTNEGSTPYFGGGWYLTPRQLVTFGQLYLNRGQWEGEQILPADWVDRSMARHTILANTNDQNPYGYLFWHKTYTVGEAQIDSIEARGSGGQYLFIVPELSLVVAITSGNYRNGKAFQPEKIMQQYILRPLIASENG